jgi:hypothetical protein
VTEALATGISNFELSWIMGTSVKQIGKTHGHLARAPRTRSGHV